MNTEYSKELKRHHLLSLGLLAQCYQYVNGHLKNAILQGVTEAGQLNIRLPKDAAEKLKQIDVLSGVSADHLLSCPGCESEAEYHQGSDSQADAIYCTQCPLGVEHSGMKYSELLLIWNNLPRRSI
ncbi:MAG: hypothetical protein QM500_19490 [Methylococcales bacterium]